jgi:chitin disaccharide deacetylase
MKQLIVNADDFGVSAEVNRGILHAHQHGIVTSTTVMINFPDAAPGLEQALNAAPDLGIGLHFNLTAGRPVSPPDSVPSLVRADGTFYPIAEWPACMMAFEDGHVQQEVDAQVRRFVEVTGQPPDHLDAHHHATYLHPVALRAMLATARQYNIPLRRGKIDAPLNVGIRILRSMMPDLTDDEGRDLIEQMERIIAEGPAPFWPARFEMGFSQDHTVLGDLLVILTNLSEDSITEILSHPGFVDEALAHSHYRNRREVEIELLTHPATLECIQAENIHLITFADLPRA